MIWQLLWLCLFFAGLCLLFSDLLAAVLPGLFLLAVSLNKLFPGKK